MSKLLIDSRENKIKEYFLKFNNNDIIVKNLDLGDIVFYLNDEPVVVIERKTISDLNSSIKDGRHREQKLRLLNTYNIKNIYYLIEGDILDFEIKRGEKDTKSIYGSILNSLIRDNIKIIRTCDLKETIKIIEIIFQKIKKQPEIFNKDAISNDYSSTIKTKKKDNMTNDICFIAQLSQIPGLSINIAKKIQEKYNSMFLLCSKYNKIEDSDEKTKILLLSDIELITNTGKTRKLGKVLSERIYKYICNK